MVEIRNDTRGARTILLTDGSRVLVDAGATETIDHRLIKRLGPGLVEVNHVPEIPGALAARAGEVGDGDRFSGFLDRSIPAITADLPQQSDDQLASILAAESGGKSRKGLITAIEAEQSARKP